MARFDVFTLERSPFDYVVDVQADILSHVDTRIVIPLIPCQSYDKMAFPRMTPVVLVKGKKYILMTLNLTAIRAESLKKRVTNIEEYRRDITDAIDFLLQGF